ncbi:hypothetical protein B566_EDAN016257 [Ephemera danica]|nr:hypothetical protein B566_EDAN016257 [Ephemera danica]
MKSIWNLFLLPCYINYASQQVTQKPNIIFILADDLGWNDVGFHGLNQFPTPNIDALAYAGIILNEYYVAPLCSPTRSALMTARHPIHTGLYRYIDARMPYGLALDEKILPQYLKELNYTSQMVGKWHLGYFRETYTPTFRGFDQYYGYFTGQLDYWTYQHRQDTGYNGLDIRNGTKVDYDINGEYLTRHLSHKSVEVIENHDTSTPLFLYIAHHATHATETPNDALQAPQETIDELSYIDDENRRTFAAMVTELDTSIGEIVAALQARGMLENSIIIFSTDNGGAAAGYNFNAASNWPLRGNKNTIWQGGVRGTGCIWSPLVPANPRVSTQAMHVQDWLPTLLGALGEAPNNPPYPLDGINAWGALSDPEQNIRDEILHMIDPDRTTVDKNGLYWNDWYGPAGRNESYDVNLVQTSFVARALSSTSRPVPSNFEILRLRSEATLPQCPILQNVTTCDPLSFEPCLFDLSTDHCEQNNLAASEPDILNQMLEALQVYNATVVPSVAEPIDPRSNPIFWNNTWISWFDMTKPD